MVVTYQKDCVNGKWSGDVDLNDGSLEQQYVHYLDRLAFVDKFGIARNNLFNDIVILKKELNEDIEFITKGIMAL